MSSITSLHCFLRSFSNLTIITMTQWWNLSKNFGGAKLITFVFTNLLKKKKKTTLCTCNYMVSSFILNILS